MADIKIEDLTTGYIDGTGVFDTLMTAVQSRLDEQYNEGRLKGSDYATAYLGAMQYAMSQAIQFLLGEQQADKQADLLQAQIDEIAAESARKDALNTAQIALITQQIVESQSKVTRDDNLANSTINVNNAEITLKGKQGSLIDQQILESEANVTNSTNKTNSDISVNTAQIDKIGAEKALLDQKKITETMQTVGNGAINTGLIGAQIRLYDKQKDGFNRDAKQKAYKTILDAWSVAITADPTNVVMPSSFTPGTATLEGLLADLAADVFNIPDGS